MFSQKVLSNLHKSYDIQTLSTGFRLGAADTRKQNTHAVSVVGVNKRPLSRCLGRSMHFSVHKNSWSGAQGARLL